MNLVEIEEALSSLALEPFDAEEFPVEFLRAFGNKETAIQRLRAGKTNQSDVAGAILQRSNSHIATCSAGEVDQRNDEVLERIYIGRRFGNDTERLKKLFELNTQITAKGKAP